MRDARLCCWRIAQMLLAGALVVAVVTTGVVSEASADKGGRANNKKEFEKERKKKENVKSLVMMHQRGSESFQSVAAAEFDNDGHLMSKKTFDPNGDVVVDLSNEYDSKGRLKGSKHKGKKNGPPGSKGGGQSRLKYNATDDITELASYADTDSMLDSMLVKVEYTYEMDGDVESLTITDNNGVQQRLQYTYAGSDSTKELDMIEEFLGDVKQSEMHFEYDTSGNTTRQTRRDPDGNILFDEELGYDGNGNMTTRKSRGRARDQVVDVFDISCEYEFDSDGALMSQKLRSKQVAAGVESETTTTYDSFGNECEQMQKNVSNDEVVSRSVWDYQYRGSPAGRRCTSSNTRNDPKRGDSQ